MTRQVSALFVETDGIYFGLPDVDPWDITRDARNYAGQNPVVAHPPCARWSSLAYVNQKHGYKVGDDGGCFESALRSVRKFRGVLEHPANSIAWKHFHLPHPVRGGWRQSLVDDFGWTTEVSQVAYGHRARKRTWLYYVGLPPADLDWRDGDGECIVSDLWAGTGDREGRGDRPRMYQREALATTESFRDALLGLARNAGGIGGYQEVVAA